MISAPMTRLTASAAAATETGGSTAVLSPFDLDAIAATEGVLDVNPVIAVALGAWLANERFGSHELLAMGVILLGVALRLLEIKAVRVASFLPALILAPIFIRVAAAVRDVVGG